MEKECREGTTAQILSLPTSQKHRPHGHSLGHGNQGRMVTPHLQEGMTVHTQRKHYKYKVIGRQDSASHGLRE